MRIDNVRIPRENLVWFDHVTNLFIVEKICRCWQRRKF
jgi:hypothetical protein